MSAQKRADPHLHFRAAPGYRGPHDHRAGLTEKEVRARLGSDALMSSFVAWMAGQTIGICPRGCSLYYPWDVERFAAGGREVWD